MTVPEGGYQPIIGPGEGIPAGTKIDTSHAGYKNAVAMATELGLSQEQFSRGVAMEARRVAAQRSQPSPPASAQPAPARKIDGYERMTFAQRLAAGGHT